MKKAFIFIKTNLYTTILSWNFHKKQSHDITNEVNNIKIQRYITAEPCGQFLC